MIKAIIFDFDGVIVESINIKTNAFAKLFEHEGNKIMSEVIGYHLNNMGVSRYEKIRFIYNDILHRVLNETEFKALCDKFAELVVDGVIMAPYVKGALEFLENYASVYECFLVSATPKEEINYILQKKAISHFFRAVYGAPTKKTEAVKEILSRNNIETHNAIYVGDTMSDYFAAKNNAVQFVARVHNNETIFRDIDCRKIKDLTSFHIIAST